MRRDDGYVHSHGKGCARGLTPGHGLRHSHCCDSAHEHEHEHKHGNEYGNEHGYVHPHNEDGPEPAVVSFSLTFADLFDDTAKDVLSVPAEKIRRICVCAKETGFLVGHIKVHVDGGRNREAWLSSTGGDIDIRENGAETGGWPDDTIVGVTLIGIGQGEISGWVYDVMHK
jgi:hypothetical protein